MRKKVIIVSIVAIILASQTFAGVVKKAKTEVNFTRFGKFTTIQTVQVSGMKKVTHSENQFKGKGIMGKLAGRFALKSGETGEIVDLSRRLTYKLDHKKREYRVEPFQTYSGEREADETSTEENKSRHSEEIENDIKVIRNEFEVNDTGQKKTINEFPSKKYEINWILEWENIRTEEKGLNRLQTTVWTTPLEGKVKECYEQEMNFSQKWMEEMGINVDALRSSILGTNWLALFSRMSEESGRIQQSAPDFEKEMRKIKGYPVIIDGKYYIKKQEGEEEAQEEEGGIKKMFGGFAKKALKKAKKKDSNEPAFSYHTELLEYRTIAVDPATFNLPSNYKKKG